MDTVLYEYLLEDESGLLFNKVVRVRVRVRMGKYANIS